MTSLRKALVALGLLSKQDCEWHWFGVCCNEEGLEGSWELSGTRGKCDVLYFQSLLKT